MNPSPDTSHRSAPRPDGATRAPGAVIVRIPGALRPMTDGADEVWLAGGTVAGVLDGLVAEHPRLGRHLLAEDGRVRDYVNVFVNDDDVRTLDGLATAVAPGDVLTVVPSIAGG